MQEQVSMSGPKFATNWGARTLYPTGALDVGIGWVQGLGLRAWGLGSRA